MSYATRNSFSNSASNPSQRAHESDYLDRMWKQYGLDESYRQDFYNNPYYFKWIKLRNQSGILSGLSEGLFGSSSASRNADQAYSDMLSYWSNLVTEKRVNTYNSPEEQASRMMAAGQNPNLLGTGDVAPDYGNPEPAYGTPLESPSADIDAVGSALNPILDIAKTYLSLRTGFANLKSIGLQNANLASSNLSSIADFARAAALDSIQPSDFDDYKADNKTFLNGIIEKSESLANNFFGEDYPNYNTARKIFKNTFNQHRSSVFANYKSWDEYSKMRGAQLDTALTDNDMSNGITMASQNLQLLRTQIEAFYAEAEAKLMTADGFKELIQEKMFSGIMSDIQRNYANVEEDTYREELWSDVNSEGVANEQAASMKQEAIARMKEAMAAQKIADIKKSDALVVQAFNDYISSNSYKRTISYYDTGTTQRHQYEQSHNRLYGSDPFVEYHPVTWNDVKTLMMLGLNRKH